MTAIQLTQKETQLLKDLKDQEQLCIQKYNRSANQSCDPQLKEIFLSLAKNEQTHYDTLTKIENGEPLQSGNSGGTALPTPTQTYDIADSDQKKDDSYLARDLLTAEKHASHLYDTCVFEFNSPQIRDTLNHIQKEEQQHGKVLYDYLSKNNMY